VYEVEQSAYGQAFDVLGTHGFLLVSVPTDVVQSSKGGRSRKLRVIEPTHGRITQAVRVPWNVAHFVECQLPGPHAVGVMVVVGAPALDGGFGGRSPLQQSSEASGCAHARDSPARACSVLRWMPGTARVPIASASLARLGYAPAPSRPAISRWLVVNCCR
jgi:hypothetical protein